MPMISRKETEARLKKMAIAAVDMHFGVYQWPDGISPIMPDGSGRTSNRELMRMAGYSDAYNNGGQALFQDKVFKNTFNLEMARRENRLPGFISDTEAPDVLKLGQAMLREALLRIENSPETFTINQLLTQGPILLKIGLELAAKDVEASNPKQQGLINQFNTLVQGNLTLMSPEERQSMLDNTLTAQDERKRRLEQHLAQIDAEEEGDDSVIDAEILSESA